MNSDGVSFQGPFSPYVQVDTIRINHYTVRDEYYMYHTKIPRVQKWWPVDVKSLEEGYRKYNYRYDDSIIRFVPGLRDRIFVDK